MGEGSRSLISYLPISTDFLALEVSYIAFLSVFLFVIYLGSNIVGRVNSILFVSMIVAYVALIGTGANKIDVKLLQHQSWGGAWMAIPLLLTSFSFQTMVPSLTPYLRGNAKRLRVAIIGGTTLALLMYLVWEALVLGIVPVEGPRGLKQALIMGEPATFYLKDAVNGGWVSSIAQFFSFFALVTSFLGIALGLFDFLSDGLKIPEKGWGKVVLILLMGVPTFFITKYLERAFHVAMDLTGGFGDAMLSGMMPVMMVWVGRYRRQMPADFRVAGGKAVLAFVFALYLGVFVLEFFSQVGWFEPSFDEPVTLDY